MFELRLELKCPIRGKRSANPVAGQRPSGQRRDRSRWLTVVSRGVVQGGLRPDCVSRGLGGAGLVQDFFPRVPVDKPP